MKVVKPFLKQGQAGGFPGKIEKLPVSTGEVFGRTKDWGILRNPATKQPDSQVTLKRESATCARSGSCLENRGY